MEKKTFSPEASPKAIGPYNHATRIGDLLFTAGQIPLDPMTNQIVVDDIVAVVIIFAISLEWCS